MVPSQTGFEPANPGSVIEKQLRISPRASGSSQRSFCSRGAVLEEDLHVAGVGRLAVEDVVAERRAAEHLAEEGELEQREAGAAVLARHVGREGADLLGPFAQAVEVALHSAEAAGEENGLKGDDFVVDETAEGDGEVADGFWNAEVHVSGE